MAPDFRICRVNDGECCNKEWIENDLQQFLQIFPTVLSALLFS